MFTKSLYDVVKKPLVTEKSTILGEQNKYVFEVAKDANKASVGKAIEKIFDVKVKAVNVINQVGKQKRFKRVLGRRSDFKKAVITLADGYSIDLAVGGK